MSLALYRKYRPAQFSEVIGQDHVTVPLGNALTSGKIHHAYLFSGPRGCGKTSSARIMARSLNCEKGPTAIPCAVCQSCVDLAPMGPGSLDVIELDAATHGLVDDARDLRDKAFYAPVHSRYKIYIIDEAHQLGPGAANALLKVVEEPPPHVLFIFATTEPDKLISTIRSRTHHYPFRLVPPALLTTHLESICKSEGVPVSKGVLPLVVRASGGSVRDALSILGQLLAGAGSDGVTYEIALHLLGFTDGALLDDAIDAIAARDGAALFQSIDRVIEAGHDPRRFAQDLLERIRDLLVLASVPDSAHSIFKQMPTDQLDRMQAQATRIGSANLTHSAQVVSEGLTQMRGATAPRLTLEFTAARILLPENSDAGVIARIERLERVGSIASLPASSPTPAKAVQPVRVESVKDEVKSITKVAAVPEKEVPAAAPKKSVAAEPVAGMDLVGLRRLWPEVIENVKGRRRLTWSLLSASAQISAIDDRAISIAMVNVGARDSFLRSNSDVILHDAFVEITGVDRTIEVIIDPSIDPGSIAKEVAESAETIENSKDVNELQGAALLARELGAKVIGEYPSK
ncbi:MAG: DNA polymerase III subunit gamma and tau [Actinobacteria bacterium]|uniref:DNA-directed DNA polymerase n=1 Tax=freshwater metagenome TaxID=449393 RepID=A0A6J6W549_9ZZZZ|nr:DNA polymerase III subunit gamma and tau [Actinomycetota bacterium]MSY05116.1 DNA polymerase III subunit gamma and tau [Actinomycetota bacterium]MSY66975.1 DNA polymerase III subunit gamma and tau [Actinomycetota bacterium]MTA00482.1 DNA polymerase III subunit gamma and tau [Actinomycetota bacterium]